MHESANAHQRPLSLLNTRRSKACGMPSAIQPRNLQALRIQKQGAAIRPPSTPRNHMATHRKIMRKAPPQDCSTGSTFLSWVRFLELESLCRTTADTVPDKATAAATM